MKVEIGKRIAKIREDMGMTKEEFAKHLGITGQYLGAVERGKSVLSVEKLKKLCDFTNLSADYILFGKDISKQNKVQKILCEFSDEQISSGCEVLEKLALFIKKC